MFQLLFIMFTLFLITIIYTYAASKFVKGKFVLLLPTVLVLGWYIIQLQDYFVNRIEGIQGLGVYFGFMIIIVVIFTNVFFGLLFLNINKRKK